MAHDEIQSSLNARKDEAPFAMGRVKAPARHYQGWLLRDGDTLTIPETRKRAPVVVNDVAPCLVVVRRNPVHFGYQISPLRSPYKNVGALSAIQNLVTGVDRLSRITFKEWRKRIEATYRPAPASEDTAYA